MSFSPLHRENTSPFDRDLATFSNYTAIRTLHSDLVWSIDWEQQIISGSVAIKLEATQDGVEEVILDVSYLDLGKVEVDGKEAAWSLGDRKGSVGQGLTIKLPKALSSGQLTTVTVHYSTTKDCTALGWLDPVQTKSGKYPYLYSQCQAIHARSLLPCQDTPAIKATYSAKVKGEMPVLMSALRQSPKEEEKWVPGKVVEYVYDQPVAIPSYLIAIASGELVYKPFKQLEGKKWRSGVWTEPQTMDDAFWEFSEDTPKFVAIAESLTTEYRWGVYDVLFLPSSFPFGGMENSCLTYATPTLIAHDKSAVDVIAHEISHSWFGNGIGCASWSHFWLNEGWTTYLERLCMRSLHGEASRQLSYIIGRKGLKEDLALFADTPKYQRMVCELGEFEDPDDAFSRVPYDKGSNFLLYLERTVGGLDVFLPYVKEYVKTFSGSSITTDQWRSHLFEYFGKQTNAQEIHRSLGKVDWDAWLHGDGLDLAVDVQYDDSLSKPASPNHLTFNPAQADTLQCTDLAKRWADAKSDESQLSQFSPADVKDFITSQKFVLLDALEEAAPYSAKIVRKLDETYGIHETDNAEIRLRFYRIALKSGKEYAEIAAKWVTDKGRMKFCRPIYRLLLDVNPDLARKTFLKHASFYHPIARKQIAKDLGVEVDN